MKNHGDERSLSSITMLFIVLSFFMYIIISDIFLRLSLPHDLKKINVILLLLFFFHFIIILVKICIIYLTLLLLVDI